jgi:hypothetical protein
MTTERYFADATIEELKAAAEACRKAAAIDDAEWDGDHADEARRLTDALGWAWDFTSWSGTRGRSRDDHDLQGEHEG